MKKIRELNFEEIALVSGDNANSNYEGGSSRNKSGSRDSTGRNGSKNIYNGVDSCGAGILGGLVAGSPTAGITGGAIAGGCTNDSFSNKSDRGSKDKSNNFAGQCRW
ncbi:hypothetical protein [Citrobacter amalonaticus]|uniref:hypothetical protein n=1 Tax=Citrobacter amalonaticus TaxID=35703 RepID=UPI0011AEFA43|nr:hypothetical protein [Citrobacter amalonaticus]